MIDRRTLLLAGLACTALPAKAAGPVSATDVLGRSISLPAPAKRIVLAQARQINALGLIHPDPISILAGWANDMERQNAEALARYRARFPAIGDVPIVGDGNTANGFSLERTIALGPDLVVLSRSLAGTRRGPGDLVEKLEAAGIPVAVVDFYLEPLRDTVPSLRALGRLIGQEARTEKLISFYAERMQRIAARIAGAARPSVFIHAHAGGYDCCMTAGQGTFNEFINAAGGRNIAAAMLPGATGQIGLEQLLSAEPDVYVATGGTHLSKLGGLALGLGVPESDAQASFAKLLATPALSTLRAIRERRAFGFWHLFNDTPLHFVAIEALAKWLHPERFTDIEPAATLAEAARFSAIPFDGTLWIAAAAKP
ncbi:ABC transporter substrate-binding protein [Bosea thiooxidans]